MIVIALDDGHVVALDHGRVVEAGTPAELLRTDGVFARISRQNERTRHWCTSGAWLTRRRPWASVVGDG